MPFDRYRRERAEQEATERAAERARRDKERQETEEHDRQEQQRLAEERRRYAVEERYLEKANVYELLKELGRVVLQRDWRVSRNEPGEKPYVTAWWNYWDRYKKLKRPGDFDHDYISVYSSEAGMLSVRGSQSRQVRYDDQVALEDALVQAYKSPEHHEQSPGEPVG